MAPKPKPLADRFWAKVDKNGPVMPGMESPCWLWMGATTKGYGSFHRKRSDVPIYVHRFAFEMACGPVPAGLSVLHRCDNPRCVRTDHLFTGSHQANMDDMVAKGRQRKGRQLHNARLTAHHVEVARKLRAWRCMSLGRIAFLFGVRECAIWKATDGGQTWRHVEAGRIQPP